MKSSIYYQYVFTNHDIYQALYENTQLTIYTYKKLILEIEFQLVRRYKEIDNELLREYISDIDEYNNKIKELEEEGKSLLIKVSEYRDKIRELEEVL